MTNRFTPKAQEALERAKEQSKNMGHTYIGTEHLLLGIMSTDGVGSKLLDQKGALYSQMYDQVTKICGLGVCDTLFSSLSPRCKKVLENSVSCSKKLGGDFVGTEHLLYAICEESDCAGFKVLSSIGISTQGIKNDIYSLCDAISSANGNVKNDIIGAPTLSLYGKSLNSVAFSGALDPLIGRKKELLQLIQILCRRSKNNPCLIGEPGVGKTAIVEGLAQLILKGEVPDELKGKIIVSLDLSAVLAGTKYRGEFEERMRAILNEVKSSRNIILFIDEVHTIMGAGGAEGAIDASNIVKPSLSRGEIRIIGATTIDEFRKSIEKDSALERRFQSIMVEEPSAEETLEILKGIFPYYEAHHKIKIAPEALVACIKLSQRYLTDRFLPDKAIDLLDEACASLKTSISSVPENIKSLENEICQCVEEKESAILDGNLSLATELRDKEVLLALELNKLRKSRLDDACKECVNEETIRKIVSTKTKIPINNSEKKENLDLLDLEVSLKQSVIGQDDAVCRVVSAIKRGRLGISNPSRPCASFLFLGPTGVGKTYLAKEIASLVFKSNNALVRFDMSEYGEKHSVSGLIGAPAGYVGYEDGGKLCEAIRRNPYCVVLFDEIEKAHPDIYNILLQILDEGELTSSNGKKVNFKNTIIILTSNLGAKETLFSSRLGFETNDNFNVDEKINSVLKAEFSSEFLNRLDEIVSFNSLSFENAKRICSILVEKLKQRVFEKGIVLDTNEEVIEFITKKGYDKAYGARSIQRAIINHFENTLCDAILKDEIVLGKRVLVGCNGENIYYKQLNI